GMALEPRAVTLGEEKNEELDDMTRRFWIAAALTAPVVALGMAEMWLTGRWVHGAEFALSTPVVVWAGWPFFVRAWQSIVNRTPNMFTLIAVGTGAAYAFSVVALSAPWMLPHSALNEHGHP